MHSLTPWALNLAFTYFSFFEEIKQNSTSKLYFFSKIIWVNFPPFLHYSEGNSENESDDDKERIELRIPKKTLTLIMVYGKRKMPYAKSDSPCSGYHSRCMGKEPEIELFSVQLSVIQEITHILMLQGNSLASVAWSDRLSFRSPKQLFCCVEEVQQLKWLLVEFSVLSSFPSAPHPYKQGNFSGIFVLSHLNQTSVWVLSQTWFPVFSLTSALLYLPKLLIQWF